MSTIISDSLPETGRSPARHAGGNTVRGRDAERRAAHDLLERARGGHGGVLLVEGEPGIGKSSLLREAVSEAAGYGFSLAADSADQMGEAIPFFAFRLALGESFARLTAEPSDRDLPAAAAWWLGRIRAHLEQRSAATPVLVCLDDLQWASAATLAALRTLPQELKHHPVAWVLARSSTRRTEVERLFCLLEDDGAARVALGPLTGEAVAAVLADAFGAPPDDRLGALAAGAAGNPWLLSELIGGLRDEDAVQVSSGRATLVSELLPERMHRAARRRLGEISERARHVLVTAAVLGPSFRLEDAAEMLDETPAVLLPAVEETMAAGITTATENAFSFRHQLLCRALADMIPPPGRRALHRQYGHILLSRGESAVIAASHLMQAADPANPASLADLDATAARTLRSAPQTAADLASRVLDLTPPGDPAAGPRTVAAAEALAAAGRLEQAGRLARDTLAKPLPPDAEARLRCVLASLLYSRGEPRDAAAEARMVLNLPELPGTLRDNAMTACLQALASLHDETAGSLAETVLADPDRYGDHVVVAALVALAAANWDKGRTEKMLDLLRDAARRQTALSPDARHAQPLLVLAAALVGLRQLGEARAILDAADGQALRGIPARAAASIVRARIHLADGRLADAAGEAGRALTIAETLGAHGYASAARCTLGAIALRGGDIITAARHVADGIVPGPHAGDVYAPAEVTLAQISQAHDGLAHAVTRIRHSLAELQARPGLLLGDPAAAAWLTRTTLAAGDTELAASAARAAQALASGNPGHPAITAAAAHSLGLAGRDAARLAEATATYPDPWTRASAGEDLGRTHAERQDHDLAVRHLTEAAQGYLDAGAAADAARTRSRLRKLGVRHRDWTRPSHRPDTGWESLTAAERAASELVAQGLNNRQVASRMYVSVHTVAFYLRQAFRKLNIRSRVELARIVIEQQSAAAAE
jgi:DNA-binding CsgD family transcriptional regulator